MKHFTLKNNAIHINSIALLYTNTYLILGETSKTNDIQSCSLEDLNCIGIVD